MSDSTSLPTTPSVAWTPIRELPDLVKRARTAQKDWARLDLGARIKRVEAAARHMLERRGQIVDLVRLEIGKLEVDALFTEGLGPVDAVNGWSRLIRRATARERIRLNPLAFPGKQAFIEYQPRGVVGIIAPWNFPVAGLYRSVLPALLTGNTVVVKPSELTPRSSGWFLDRLAESLPENVVQVAYGDGEVGAALVEAEPDALVFTGSTATGRTVSARAAALGLPCSAEMGGNDGAIVLEDADLERTAAGLTQWALQNAGQACGAVEVAYVEHGIADQLVDRLRHAWLRLRTGPGPVGEVDVAPLAYGPQLAKVEAHVADALQKGATLACGGRRTPIAHGYEPTLLDHCTDEMEVVQQETFGPVLAVCRVEGPTEAIRRINRGRYGLTASLWTQDLKRAERLAPRLDVGVVTINNHGLTGAIPDLPWSGRRDSGLGIANSVLALSTFVRPQTLLIDGAKGPEPYWLPHDQATWLLGDALADAQLLRFDQAWRIPLLLRQRVKRIRSFFSISR